jgi:hypothetical protein
MNQGHTGAYWSHPHYDHYREGWRYDEGHWDHEDHGHEHWEAHGHDMGYEQQTPFYAVAPSGGAPVAANSMAFKQCQ